MSATAVVMMVVAMVVIWGGLIAAIVNLRFSHGPDGSQPEHPPSHGRDDPAT